MHRLITLCNTKTNSKTKRVALVNLGVPNTNMKFIFFYHVRFFQHFTFQFENTGLNFLCLIYEPSLALLLTVVKSIQKNSDSGHP